MHRFEAGVEVAGFRIDGIAGRGGMGVVYRAHQPALDRPVALKVIAPSLAEDDSFRARFVRESKAAASIDHPNVIPIYSAGEEDGVLYLAMRYVDGEDLRSLIRQEGHLEPERAAHIVAQVASALDAAHARGLVHRDVKPANILLAPGDHAYLTDFGLTKIASSDSGATRSGHWVGTLGYVAPEQIQGERVDARADVYALGCVLFHSLTGHAPFPRENDSATLWAHLNSPPPSVRDTVPELPSSFDAVLARALAKDPEDRYPSAGDLGRAALAAAGSAPAPADERSVAVGEAAPELDTESPTVTAGTRRHALDPETPTAAAAPRPPATAPRGPRRGLLAGLAALILAGVAAAVVVLATGGDDNKGGATTSTATPSANEPAGRVVDTIKVDPRPNTITYSRGAIWVASSSGTRIVRFDAGTGQKLAPVTGLTAGVTALATGLDSVWVANHTTRLVSRVNPQTLESAAEIPVSPGQPFSLDVSSDSVWVGIRGGVGLSEDPTLKVVRQIRPGAAKVRNYEVAGGVQDLAIGPGTLWVTNRRKAAVTRFDLLTRTGGRTREVRVGQDPEGVAVGPDAVWVANRSDNTVTRITLDGRVTKTIPVGVAPVDVVVSGDDVWVSNSGDDTLTRIDARTGKVAGRPVRVGATPLSLVARGRTLWVTDKNDGAVTKVQWK